MATFKEIFSAMNLLYRVDEKIVEDILEDIDVDFIVNSGSYEMFCEGLEELSECINVYTFIYLATFSCF